MDNTGVKESGEIRKVLAVTGPTATGKTGLAVKLFKHNEPAEKCQCRRRMVIDGDRVTQKPAAQSGREGNEKLFLHAPFAETPQMIEQPDKNQYVDQAAADDVVKIDQQMIIVFEIQPRQSMHAFVQHACAPPEGKGFVGVDFSAADDPVDRAELSVIDMKHPLFTNGFNNGKTGGFIA